MIVVKVEQRIGFPPDTSWKVVLNRECDSLDSPNLVIDVLHNLFQKIPHRVVILSDND